MIWMPRPPLEIGCLCAGTHSTPVRTGLGLETSCEQFTLTFENVQELKCLDKWALIFHYLHFCLYAIFLYSFVGYTSQVTLLQKRHLIL
jgi:hypothetical protein